MDCVMQLKDLRLKRPIIWLLFKAFLKALAGLIT